MRAALSLALACASLGGAASAAADDRPLTRPTRDVDIVYRITRPGGPPDQPGLLQRTRWTESGQKLRVDPPSPGLYVVMDYGAHLLSAVRPAQRLVLQVKSDGATVSLAGTPVPKGGFLREGDSTVAGLACTEWQTRDAAGEAVGVCLTADGVMLRARIGPVALVEATSVTYGTIDAGVFDVPQDFRRVGGSPP